jgi:hypothetical protein
MKCCIDLACGHVALSLSTAFTPVQVIIRPVKFDAISASAPIFAATFKLNLQAAPIDILG